MPGHWRSMASSSSPSTGATCQGWPPAVASFIPGRAWSPSSTGRGSCHCALYKGVGHWKHYRVLTGEEGHVIELLHPLIGDLNCIVLEVDAIHAHPLLAGMVNHLLEVVGVDGVEHVEEVLPRRVSVFWQKVGEKEHELRVLLEIWPELDHGDLVVLWNVDEVDFRLLQEPLLVDEDKLEEVFINLGYRREVVLD